MTYTVVVSRYNKNTDWVNQINENIIIYDKETLTNPYNVPLNKGNEASVYLKYIIDHYDDLPEYTFFIHDEEFSWHHSGSVIDKFKEAKDSNQLYYNINDRAIMTEHFIIIAVHGTQWWNDFWIWYKKYVDPYIPSDSLPSIDFTHDYRGAAQFLVHRNLIRNLPKQFYEDIYDWLLTTDMENSKSGRFLEWTWHVFWDIYPNQILSQI
jgi:hypothetical protein